MEANPQKSSGWVVWLIVGLVLLCLCVVILAGIAVALYYVNSGSPTSLDLPLFGPTVEPTVPVSRPPAGSISHDTADALAKIVIPQNDFYDLACRLQSVCNASTTLPAPNPPYKVGDKRQFWVQDQDTIKNFQVDTTLRYITDHSYFWLEDGVDANPDDISALMTTFEDKIYPTDRRFFGSEWTPGVDNDPHVYVLYVRGIGATTGGYFSPYDEFNPLVRKYSNGVELFVFNADGMALDNEYTYGTLAHEFQHMIHENLDRNEVSWVNEGFSELASFLNGYSVGGTDWAYANEPDLSLNDWTSLSDSPDVTSRHYGESFLFFTYFLDRFGPEATQALVRHPENSLTGVDAVLRELNITDPQTGKVLTADDVIMDWMLAMYLQDDSVGDGRYKIHNYSDAPQSSATQRISQCPRSPLSGSVSQFGPEYVEISCTGDHSLEFLGSTSARVLPADAHSGKYAFWSNKADQSDLTLTREFDLTGVSGAAQFSYWTWYDIEDGWDYLYLEASTDGKSWTILKTPSCSSADVSGNAFGCGYTGKSAGGSDARWIQESVDLSAYAGQKVQLRFEYITDTALNGEGLLLDDLSLPALNYAEDFESGDGGWESAGWARIENILPQTFRLALIRQLASGTTVEYLQLSEDQSATIPLSLESGETAVLVVTGTQRFTRIPAGYTIEVK